MILCETLVNIVYGSKAVTCLDAQKPVPSVMLVSEMRQHVLALTSARNVGLNLVLAVQ